VVTRCDHRFGDAAFRFAADFFRIVVFRAAVLRAVVFRALLRALFLVRRSAMITSPSVPPGNGNNR
jgi:hypothetical protein